MEDRVFGLQELDKLLAGGEDQERDGGDAD
jgi:hypothetical protein